MDAPLAEHTTERRQVNQRRQVMEPWHETLPPADLKRLEAWLSLPDGDRAELLEGRIVYKAMASLEHGDAAGSIFAQLDRFRGPPGGGAGKGGGWWLSQDVDMYLAGQGLRPDLVGWRVDKNPRPPQKVNIGKDHLGVYTTPPDWVCEILSPSTRSRDEEEGVKWRAYHAAGVDHYWLVDLSREQILVYQRHAQGYAPIVEAGGQAARQLPPFEEAEFAIHRVFLMARILRSNQL